MGWTERDRENSIVMEKEINIYGERERWDGEGKMGCTHEDRWVSRQGGTACARREKHIPAGHYFSFLFWA